MRQGAGLALPVAILAGATALARPAETEPAADIPTASPAAQRARPPAREIAFTLLRVRPGRSLQLRHAPAGVIRATLRARTEFGSPTVLPVLGRTGGWLGVPTSELGNHALGWVRRDDPALTLSATRVSLRVSLSRRTLVLRSGGRHIRRVAVSVGATVSPTPRGRFAVTDKLRGARFSRTYGCCILALSGRQPNLPPGWRGGDRLAVHAGETRSTVGRAASAGCLRGTNRDLRALMRTVPLGAPVFVGA